MNCKRFKPAGLLLARDHNRVVGMLHMDTVRNPYFDHAGVVEMICVDPEYRGRRVATNLLRRAMRIFREQGGIMLDGFGSWPYSPFYTTLIDGSERSGVFLQNPGMLRLFEQAGFKRSRESLVMRVSLGDLPALTDNRQKTARQLVLQHRRREYKDDWLDFVFRGWHMQEHCLFDTAGRMLSRAIFCRMQGPSDYSGRELYALFGVNTPECFRGRGYAYINLWHLLSHLQASGADEVELHVYADNIPAIGLYRSLGFRDIGRTVSLRRG